MGTLVIEFLARVFGLYSGPSRTSEAFATGGTQIVNTATSHVVPIGTSPGPLQADKIALRASPYFFTAGSYVYGIIIGIIGIIVIAYQFNVLIATTGRRVSTGTSATLTEAFRGTSDWITSTRSGMKASIKGRTWKLLIYLFVSFEFTIIEAVYLTIRACLQTLILFLDDLPIMFLLWLIHLLWISIETDTAGWFDSADFIGSAVEGSTNVLLGVTNFVGSVSLAVFLAPYNASIRVLVEILRVIVDFVEPALLGGSGRRALVDAGNAQPILDVLESIALLFSQILIIIGQFLVLALKLILALFAPVLPAVLDLLASIMQPIFCVIENIPCGILEIFNIAVEGAVGLLNGFLSAILNPFTSLFGVGAISPIVAPNIGCGGGDLSNVACACSSYFAGIQPCSDVSYSCSTDSNGLFTEYTTQNGVVTAGPASQDRSVACHHSRRMLTALGYMVNMGLAGQGLGCQTSCINGTLIRACPVVGVEHMLYMEGSCGAEGWMGTGRRALGTDEEHADYLHQFFELEAPPVFVNTARRRTESVKAAAARAREAERAGEARQRAGGHAGITRAEVEAKIRENLRSVNGAGVLECDFPTTANAESDNIVSRHSDLLCMMERSSMHGAVERDAQMAHAAARAVEFAHKRPRRVLGESEDDHSLVHFAASLRVRASSHSAVGGIDSIITPITRRRSLEEETAGPAVLETGVKHTFSSIRRELSELKGVVDGHTQRGRSLSDSSSNIFRSKKKEACPNYLCYDGVTCLVDKKLCPAVSVYTPTIAINYAVWKIDVATGDLDERFVISSAFHCFEMLEANPETDPQNARNINRDVLHDPNMRWCAPMVKPFLIRFQKVDINLRKTMETNCAGGVCSCDGYFAGNYDTTHWWFRGMPYYEYARIHNAAASLQWSISDLLTRGTAFDEVWQEFFSPLKDRLPLWFVRLWGDQGHAGSIGTQRMCAFIHGGSVVWVIIVVRLVVIFYFGFRELFYYVILCFIDLLAVPFEFYSAGSPATEANSRIRKWFSRKP